jgi:hypothetical protein
LGMNPSALRPGVRGARWTQGQAGVGNAHLANAATSQEAWPEVAPKTTKVPLAKAAVERRQPCAFRRRRGRARKARHNSHCVCRRFASEFLFVIASEAKQSSAVSRNWIASSLSLLAMTGMQSGLKAKNRGRHHPCFLFAPRLRASRDCFFIARMRRRIARMSTLACLP